VFQWRQRSKKGVEVVEVTFCDFEGGYYGWVVVEVWEINGARCFGHRGGVMSRLGERMQLNCMTRHVRWGELGCVSVAQEHETGGAEGDVMMARRLRLEGMVKRDRERKIMLWLLNNPYQKPGQRYSRASGKEQEE